MKMKRVTLILAKGFVSKLCVDTKEGIVEPGEEILFLDQVDFVKSFCNLGNRLNASGGSEAVITAKTRIGWKKLRECGEIIYWRKFSLKSCIRSAIIYGSKTWCLRENETAILRRTKKEMMRAMCGKIQKLIQKRRSQELMSLLGFKNTLDRLVRLD